MSTIGTHLPSHVAGYAVGERLGLGAMGVVVRGRHLALGRDVAIKFRFKATRADEDLLAERFRQGAIRQSELSHVGIAELYDFVETNDYQAIIMQYLAGGSIESWIRAEGQLPISAAMEVAIRVSEAMAVAHEAGVIHRDIKPGNLILEAPHEPRTVCVTDFGVAKAPERSPDITIIGANVGTIWYMPPEQLSSHSDLDPRVDVYAIGATLYEMLTGHVPFQEADTAEVFKRFLDGEPLPPIRSRNAAVPESICAIIDAALALEPDERIPTAAALAALLRSAVRSEGLNYPEARSVRSRRIQRDKSIGDALKLLAPPFRAEIAMGLRDTESELGTPTQSIKAVTLTTEDTSIESPSLALGPSTALDTGENEVEPYIALPTQQYETEDDAERTIVTMLDLSDLEEN